MPQHPSEHGRRREVSDTPDTDNLARGNHVVPTEWAVLLCGVAIAVWHASNDDYWQ